MEEVYEEKDDDDKMVGKDEQVTNKHLDEEPDVVLLLHLWAATVRWAEARHGCRANFSTSTHGESSCITEQNSVQLIRL